MVTEDWVELVKAGVLENDIKKDLILDLDTHTGILPS